jgi:hypothetical protein
MNIYFVAGCNKWHGSQIRASVRMEMAPICNRCLNIWARIRDPRQINIGMEPTDFKTVL